MNDWMLMPPASEREITIVEEKMKLRLPNSYKDLLRDNNGLSVNGRILIYGTQDIMERNETWDIQVFAQGYIAIGDDGGGRVFLMHQGDNETRVLIVPGGDKVHEHAHLLTSDFTQWVQSGFLINLDETEDDVNWSKNCEVVLIDTIDGGLKDLLKIKRYFRLDIAAADLLKGSKNLPFIIVKGFPYGLANKLVGKLENIKIELRVMK
ncbi:SMI1/KNR4 family protein [Niallia taxi]|uniref:SMI1/KNR4 family protein n=1 Tax=Niallia taxi TaxID=2499688 RepID=A0A3S2WZ96_9BACI|nr:SMI1/KNR4 family protein [Niallia taxi]RVT57214.1 SMI1/KNR4 family protein [Niallia taxi]